jgi:hypothetical protein
MTKTAQQFSEAIARCKKVFSDKMQDYGSAWRILRTTSLTDQIYIKANRIRSIQEKGNSMVEEGIEPEFIGIVNYSVMALIQLEKGTGQPGDLSKDELNELYDKHIGISTSLMENKNHDYDEAWRIMRVSSLDDIILMKLHRTKEIEDKKGITLVSEGLEANYQDIINYALFALIKISEEKQ